MKVGTITFHWATNYGAVLQAFALQTFLSKNGFDSEIIRYLPRQTMVLQKISWFIRGEFSNFKKEKKISFFRQKYMILSKGKYYSNRDLRKKRKEYDAIICGSDQVWNFSFLEYAERNKTTLSYYLNFVDSQVQRIAYATSFGTDVIPPKYIHEIKHELSKFNQIGVRENTAKHMLEEIGLQSQVVLDPTLLLDKGDYEKLLKKGEKMQKFDFFPFVLHENQELAEQCKQYILSSKKEWINHYSDAPLSVEEWLFHEKNTQLVLTNSFHSTVFAVLFHTPFIVVPVKGSNMNDRIETFLSVLGLEEHYVKEYDEKKIEQLLQKQIDWELVDRKLDCEKKKSQQFLLNSLKNCTKR